MTAAISGGDLTAFEALSTMEAQAMFLLCELEAKQQTANATATTPVNRVAIVPNYGANSVTAQLTLALSANAVQQTLPNSVVAFLT